MYVYSQTMAQKTDNFTIGKKIVQIVLSSEIKTEITCPSLNMCLRIFVDAGRGPIRKGEVGNTL